ncbi:MAG: deoxyribonuclease IV [Thermoplasmatales archaeon]
MRIGGHLSTREGFQKLPENASKLGLRTYQFFSKNQMQWKGSPIKDQDASSYRESKSRFRVDDEAIHASYLINLGTPEDDKLKKSYEAFLDEIRRADRLGVKRLIFHPGAHMGSGEEKALTRISDSMNRAIEETKRSNVILVVENTAGQGSVVGYSIEHLEFILRHIEEKGRVGFCIDTCHAFQAGYDLNRDLDGFISEIDGKLGIKNIAAVHLNDSKYPLGKHLDRHENLGKGHLSKDFFVKIFSDKRLKDVPSYLETPLGEEGYPDDINFLSSLGIKL